MVDSLHWTSSFKFLCLSFNPRRQGFFSLICKCLSYGRVWYYVVGLEKFYPPFRTAGASNLSTYLFLIEIYPVLVFYKGHNYAYILHSLCLAVVHPLRKGSSFSRYQVVSCVIFGFSTSYSLYARQTVWGRLHRLVVDSYHGVWILPARHAKIFIRFYTAWRKEVCCFVSQCSRNM